MRRTMTARSRLEPWANVSRQQTDEETYGLRVDSVDCGGGTAGAVAGSSGAVVSVERADGTRGVAMSDDPISRIRAALEAEPSAGPWTVLPAIAGEQCVAKINALEIVPPTGIELARDFIDAEYIAACNPVAICALLDRMKAAEEAENERLRRALTKANAQAEHFEREWYLRGDEVERLRAATQAALNVLEQLQGGCTDSDDGTVEAITVWCPETIDELRAALENTNG